MLATLLRRSLYCWFQDRNVSSGKSEEELQERMSVLGSTESARACHRNGIAPAMSNLEQQHECDSPRQVIVFDDCSQGPIEIFGVCWQQR